MKFSFFCQLSRSFFTFVCLLGEKLPALASLSRKTRARPRAVGEYETCLFRKNRNENFALLRNKKSNQNRKSNKFANRIKVKRDLLWSANFAKKAMDNATNWARVKRTGKNCWRARKGPRTPTHQNLVVQCLIISCPVVSLITRWSKAISSFFQGVQQHGCSKK